MTAYVADNLTLAIPEYRDATHWVWRLTDRDQRFLADHEVALDDSSAWQYEAFLDLDGYLALHAAPDNRHEDEQRLLREFGEWLGREVFGTVGERIVERSPVNVRVQVPPAAEGLLYRPLEFAHVAGRPLALQEVSLIFTVDGESPTIQAQADAIDKLRILSVFSLPTDASALNLRHERSELKKLIEGIAQRRGLAIELRVLQYGVTRQALQHVLEEGDGWDIVHFSGHGTAAHLVLERLDGARDVIPSPELVDLLRPTRRRLKWVTLSACSSADATVNETLAWLGLEPRPTDPTRTEAHNPLPAVARSLIANFDCAVLAMRFPINDEFAISLGQALYGGVLDQKQSLPRALQFALAKFGDGGETPLSLATPALFGRRAAELQFIVPRDDLDHSPVPHASGMAGFPDPPQHFVGRVQVMIAASTAVAPRSGKTGVLFHGMSGGGKTACALELADQYRNLERFTGYVWYKAPAEGSEIADALVRFAIEWEHQLSDENLRPLFPLVHMVAAPLEKFRAYLARLREFLERRSIFIVLDNLESLLNSNGNWRDERWGELLAALLAHSGSSFAVLTSRVPPRISNFDGRSTTGRLVACPIYTLSLDEAVLLARQLPNMGRLLMGDQAADTRQRDEDRRLVLDTLLAVQGHPKLLELAEQQAGNPVQLRSCLERAGAAWTSGTDKLAAFFETGKSQLAAAELLTALSVWTASASSSLPTAARFLFRILCCLEEGDRQQAILAAIWPDLWPRIGMSGTPAPTPPLLESLHSAGLVEVHAKPVAALAAEPATESGQTTDVYEIHPGVAAAGCRAAGDDFQQVVDHQVTQFWVTVFDHASQQESQGSGQRILHAGHAAVPYLIRQQQWIKAAELLEQVLHRDDAQATLVAVLPLFRRIADATEQMAEALAVRGALAKALLRGRQWAEAESLLRQLIERAVAENQFHVAAGTTGDLIHVLKMTGRAVEALPLVDTMKQHVQTAGFGRWTELAGEAYRLQILVELGRYEEVLARAESLRQEMRELHEPNEQPESVSPWSVRELILNSGRNAAIRLGQWESALSSNAEIFQSQAQRGASALEIARTRWMLSARCWH
jgi:tetratricopeptide (TPR) repeat protein